MDTVPKRNLKREFRLNCDMPSCAFCSYFDIWSERISVCWNLRSKFNGLRVKANHVCDDFVLDEVDNLKMNITD